MQLLIPDPTSLSNDNDFSLPSLTEELKELWNDGINTYDAHIVPLFAHVQQYYELSMIFLHKQCCMVGV